MHFVHRLMREEVCWLGSTPEHVAAAVTLAKQMGPGTPS